MDLKRTAKPNPLTPRENATFVAIMVATFSTAEREAWGSTFAKAERAQWIVSTIR